MYIRIHGSQLSMSNLYVGEKIAIHVTDMPWLLKGEEIVGHVPQYMSTACSLFMRRGGSVYCTITERRRYSRDLPQGGMEVLCLFRFVGNGGELKKLKSFFKTSPISSDNGNHLSSNKHIGLDASICTTEQYEQLLSKIQNYI